MIAEDEHDVARVPQAEQQVDHRGRVAAAVDEIAQKHERVVGLRGDRLEQRFEGQQAAMHIAERDQPRGGVGGHGGEDEVRRGGETGWEGNAGASGPSATAGDRRESSPRQVKGCQSARASGSKC